MKYYLVRLRLGDEFLPNWIWVIRLEPSVSTMVISNIVQKAMKSDWDDLPDAVDVDVRLCSFENDIASL